MQNQNYTSGEYPFAPAMGMRGDSVAGETPFAVRRESRHCPVCCAATVCEKRSQQIAAAHSRQGSAQNSVKSLCRNLSGTAW